MTKEIENAQNELKKNLESLYHFFAPTGDMLKVNGDELHEQKHAEYIANYHDALRGIVADAEQRKADANAVLQRTDRLQYNWLTDEELARADTLLHLVADDLEALQGNPSGLVDYLQDAANSEDRALQFIALKKAANVWNADPSYNPLVVHTYEQSLEDLRQVVTPGHLLTEEATAKADLIQADVTISKAAYLLPDGDRSRAGIGAALGIDADNLPEEMPTIEEILAPSM